MIKIIKRLQVNAQEATDLNEIRRGREGKTLNIFGYLEAPLSYDSN
jgi:hypothetical protein